MQKRALKILTFIFLLFLSSFIVAAKPMQPQLVVADSLFTINRYTQALATYQHLFAEGHYTPAMLLKMAYIHEALGNVAETQYFLNLYFISTNDASVLEKMEELAQANALEGYQTSEWQKLLLLYRKNSLPVLVVTMAIAVLALAWLLTTLRASQTLWAPFSALVLTCSLLVVLGNASTAPHTSIIIEPNAYIMSGPSAGANVLEIAGQGHKVAIIGKKDVWLKIRWRERVAYLKESSLAPVSL
jgi:hypothetical protein